MAARAAAGSRGRGLVTRPLGRQRQAVPPSGRRDAPDRRPERAHQRGVRRRLQRGQVARLGDEHDPDGRRDRRGDLVAGPRGGPLEPDPAGPGGQRARHRRQRPALRDDRPRRGRRAIGCWNDKYYWSFWRPITAIRLADTDGNPATVADPTWTPLFDPRPSRPPLVRPRSPTIRPATLASPARSSTRSRPSSAPTRSPSARSATTPRTTRTFARFSEALKEVIDARVWGGIHFRTADVQGSVLGMKVSHYLVKHYFRPAN